MLETRWESPRRTTRPTDQPRATPVLHNVRTRTSRTLAPQQVLDGFCLVPRFAAVLDWVFPQQQERRDRDPEALDTSPQCSTRSSFPILVLLEFDLFLFFDLQTH